jgi:phenylacetate-coenzyme A ligase PaaK-like adenylate-forming protein
MAIADGDTERLTAEILAFIEKSMTSDEEFNNLALRIFAHQFDYNPAFQRFCQMRAKTPRTVKRWQDIPAVPINGFKDLTLSCVPVADCTRVFMTSGTTRGDIKGRHFHPKLTVYDASMKKHFQACFMKSQKSVRMGIIFPNETMMPNSSLAHYLALAVKNFGTTQSAYYLDDTGIKIDSLIAALQEAQDSGQAFALLGASYSFVHLFDELEKRQLKFKLPLGSRILDTGGFKGQSREIEMNDFYEQLAQTFGLARSQCINMYGMTELSTQFYDAGNEEVPSVKRGPHWMRSRLVDPVSGEEVAFGDRGILAHTDLANFNSTVTILTEDVGTATQDGFLLLGRAQGVEAKGCSMVVDEFLRSASA